MYKIGDWIPIAEYLKLPLATSGAYILRNKVNGKEYVGKSVDVRKRMKTHLETKSTRYLYRAFEKHGRENFELCLYLQGTEEEVTELEGLLIAERKTFAPAGYNMTLGGDGATGWVASEETREKMRNNQLGSKHSEETIAKMKASGGHRKGATMSEEAKAKIGAASSKFLVGRPVSAETRRKMSIANTGRPSGTRKGVKVVKNCDGTTQHFHSMAEAAEFLGVTVANVSNWCSGRYKPRIDVTITRA